MREGTLVQASVGYSWSWMVIVDWDAGETIRRGGLWCWREAVPVLTFRAWERPHRTPRERKGRKVLVLVHNLGVLSSRSHLLMLDVPRRRWKSRGLGASVNKLQSSGYQLTSDRNVQGKFSLRSNLLHPPLQALVSYALFTSTAD